MSLPCLDQDPCTPDFVQNPYPFYERLRAAGPVVDWPAYGPVTAHHGLVNAILRDRRFGRENPKAAALPERLEPWAKLERNSMLEREPPLHTRLRGLVVRAFTSRRIAGLGPSIEALAGELVDGLPWSDGSVDLLPSFCERLPVITICRLLGVPVEKADDLLAWSHAMVAMYQARRDRATEDAAVAASAAFDAYMRDLIEARRSAPGDDLLSALIAVEEAGDRLSLDEMVSTAILLLNAGHEATVHALGNGIKAVLEADLGPAVPHLDAPVLADEIMRFDPPLHLFMRWAKEDVDLGVHRFEQGAPIALLLGAANRDPQVFKDPNRFDPERLSGAHVALGAGHHFCVGAPLARLEIARALPVLFARCPNLTLAHPPLYADRFHFRSLSALKVSQ